MPRLNVVPIKKVYARRAKEYEYHLNNRRTVKNVFSLYDQASVIRVLRREIPEPVMRTDGSLVDGIPTLRGRATAAGLLNIDQKNKELMCLWYWSDEGWDDFNRQYQNLPEIYEDHYFRYDEALDIVDLVPLSENQRAKPSVQPRYKSSTSKQLVPRNQE
jgi:hypothetical protein